MKKIFSFIILILFSVSVYATEVSMVSQESELVIDTQQMQVGSILIKYVDDQGNLLGQEMFQNLILREYVFTSKIFENYSLDDDQSKKVLLDEQNPDQELFFKYKRTAPSKVDELPLQYQYLVMQNYVIIAFLLIQIFQSARKKV